MKLDATNIANSIKNPSIKADEIIDITAPIANQIVIKLAVDNSITNKITKIILSFNKREKIYDLVRKVTKNTPESVFLC